ncbi:MAG: 3-hydroxyacyl-CoA dehydrogenase family protein [Thermodesulfobacteriota bacterium]
MTPVSAAITLQVMVLGAGTMGHGLALLAAKAGNPVFLVDSEPAALEKAQVLIRSQLEWLRQEGELGTESPQQVLDRIQPLKNFEDAVSACDLVLEAVSEDETVKADLFQNLASRISSDCIVASNTSYLDVFSIAGPDILPRLAIAHFYAPPYLIPLVEVVGGEKTAQDVVPRLASILDRMGQRPVVMQRFIPGYIVNRLQRALGREIFYLLDNGYAGPEEIDEAVQASLGLRMPVLGVVRRYDFTGLDISLKFLSNPSIYPAGENPLPPSLKARIDAGDLGVKTGRGFYPYGNRSTADILQERDRRLLALRRFLARENIALKF